jgi:hypothetical protein
MRLTCGRWAVLIALLIGPSAFAADGPTVRDRIGAIAKAALSPQAPETPGLLRGGLLDPSPAVRAAAARVGRTMGARGLVPELKAALAQEAIAETAAEMEDAVRDLETPNETESEQAPAVRRMRTLSGYPAEFFAAVLQATDCKGKADAFEVADVTFRASGRPKALQMLRTQPSSTNCNRALEILALSAVRSGSERFVRLVLPDQPEFLACPPFPRTPRRLTSNHRVFRRSTRHAQRWNPQGAPEDQESQPDLSRQRKAEPHSRHRHRGGDDLAHRVRPGPLGCAQRESSARRRGIERRCRVVLHAHAAQRHARARHHDRDGELPPQLRLRLSGTHVHPDPQPDWRPVVRGDRPVGKS